MGRVREADLCLDEPRVSSRHAEVFYQRESWFLRDLGSRNGTRVDGEPVVPGVDVTLRPGSRVEFARPSCAWRVCSVAAPRAAALSLDGGAAVEEEDGVIALPGGEAPVSVLIHDHAEGWHCRRGDDERRVHDADVVEAGGRLWRLSLPSGVLPTLASLDGDASPNVALRFQVSRDEEHVELLVRWGERSFTPPPRAHTYTLLTLARHRLADELRGELPLAERGWIHQDELCRRLRLDANLLHTHLFRARRQLADAGVPGAEGLYERRLQAGQLRISVATIEVVAR